MTFPRGFLAFPLFLVVLALGATLRAQTFTQVRDTGPRANRLNIVFMAEGYTAAESAKFSADAAVKLQVILGNEAWIRFADSINGFTIFVASTESGSDDPTSGIVRDTYFNSTFNFLGIDRLLALPSSGTSKVQSLLTQFVPDWDVVIVIVNSTKYGGAGGFPTVVSLNSSADEVVLHELGHSFAKLTDEYVDLASAPNYPPAEYANATQNLSRTTSPWSAFIAASTPVPTVTGSDENTVGLFLGAHYRDVGFYRPTNNSKMRSLARPFGPVNVRAFANEVHRQNLNRATAKPVITVPPAAVQASAGQTVSLRVTATGTGPLTYLWRFNDVYLPTALEGTLTLANLSVAQTGSYVVEITNAAGTTISSPVTVSIGTATSAPVVAALPTSASALTGENIVLTASATGTAPLSYQWLKNGAPIAGATNATLTLVNLQNADAGSYAVRVTNSAGSTTSSAVTVGLIASRLSNVSVRTTLTANQILTVGFTMQGGDKSLLVRAGGPALTSLGVVGAMADPRLTLFSGQTSVATNDNWGSENPAGVSSVGAAVGAFPFAASSLDAAIVRTIQGGYTAQVSGPAAGNVLVEAYDGGAGLTPRLINVSALNRVGTGGDVLIAGFTLAGTGTKNLLIRAVGPTLAAAPFNLAGTLVDPLLQLFDSSQKKIGENDNYTTAEAATFSSVGAFSLVAGSKDAALVTALPPGGYTVQVSGADGGTGLAIVEIYELP